MESVDTNVADAQKAIEKIISDNENLNSDMSGSAKQDLTELKEMLTKIQSGVVEIAVYGEVSAGKSALLNALLGDEQVFKVGAAAGFTTTTKKTEWIIGNEDYKVVFVDTPGIGEAGEKGKKHAQIAEEAIKFADIIMFIIDEDTKDHEVKAIKQVNKLNKPVIVVFNKIDTHDIEAREEITNSVLSKLKGIVPEENLIPAAGLPLKREYCIEKADGTVVTEFRRPKPIIDALKLKILEVLENQGLAIVALNASLFASDVEENIKNEKIRIKDNEVRRLIKKYAISKALVVGANPMPGLDIAAGMGTDVAMIFHLSKVYNIKMTWQGSQKLIEEMAKHAAALGVGELIQYAAIPLAKTMSFGVATIVLGIPQGILVAYTTILYGGIAREYFKNDCSWGDEGAKAIVKRILTEEATMTKSILEEVKEGILQKIGNKEPETQSSMIGKGKQILLKKADSFASMIINLLTKKISKEQFKEQTATTQE